MRLRRFLTALVLPAASLRAQATWTVDAKPILDVAGVSASGAVNFENAAGATRLRDGSLLIADRGPASIRVIDATGKLVKTVGRKGDGPGEFHTIISAVGCGPDSMLVWDLNHREASMAGPTGAVARRFKIPSDSGTRVRGPLFAIACGSRGTIAYISDLTGRVATAGGNPDLMSMLSSAVTTNRDGRILNHVDSVPSGEMVHAIINGGNGGYYNDANDEPHVAVFKLTRK